MSTGFLDPPGLAVPGESLRLGKARALAEHIASEGCPFTRIIECFSEEHSNSVVFETEVSLPQHGSRFGIEDRERVAVVFFDPDDRMPEVLALRSTFPSLPHQNRRKDELPRSLCVSDQPYEELQRRWSPRLLLEFVRTWLARAARGQLHGADQPLEPFFLGTPSHFILPSTVFSSDASAPLHVDLIPGVRDNDPCAFVTSPAGSIANPKKEFESRRTLALAMRTPTVEHGVIRAQPENLEQLAGALEETGFDLLRELRRRLRAWNESAEKFDVHLSRLAIVLWIPKKRRAGDGEPEVADTFAFLTAKHVVEVGEDVGAWETHMVNGLPQPATIVGLGDDPANDNSGANTPVVLLPVSFHFSRETAARMASGEPSTTPTLVVGVGALGSQVATNLARAGFGRLTLVDDDVLLPHNLSRHGLAGDHIGHLKARALAEHLSSLFRGEPPVEALCANVLSRDEEIRAGVIEAIQGAELILDMSASIAVARFLARGESDARRVSTYLNPSGTDVVLLAEDTGRELTLHDLEIQYYRALLLDDLRGHFTPAAERVRYGQGCRDLSVVLSPDQAALFAALATTAIRSLQATAKMTVWRTKPDGNVHRIDLPTSPVHRLTVGGWTVVLDHHVVDGLRAARIAKFPNETGGVIVGSHDLEHRTVHLVAFVASPEDSEEWPSLYIRGSRDLLRKVRAFSRPTDGMLVYVGEWHSHPEGHDASPSDLDRQAISNLAADIAPDGLPALAIIVGEANLAVLLHDGSSHEVLLTA